MNRRRRDLLICWEVLASGLFFFDQYVIYCVHFPVYHICVRICKGDMFTILQTYGRVNKPVISLI